jgi:hypothetical protein
VRSETPSELTAAGWRAVREYGVRTIVDLRCPTETPYELADGLRRVSVPVFEFADEPFVARLRATRSHAEGLALWLDERGDRIASAVAAIENAGAGAVLVHCQGGRDRTGLLVALLLGLAGAPDGAIVEDYLASAAALQPRYDRWIAEADDDELRERRRLENVLSGEGMLGLLRTLREDHGGPRDYLLAAGTPPALLDRLRARLRGDA